MKAAYLTGIREMEIRRAPDPKPENPDDVLLRIETVGVCGSDMHYYRRGRIGDMVVEFPWLLGHECAGTVVQVAPGVSGVKVGDRVAVDPLIWCGRCDQCLRGRRHTCRDQVFMGCPGQLPGCLTELVVMPERCCHRIPQRMSMEQATMIEPLTIGMWAQRLCGDPSGRKIAILGSGPIGLCVLLALKAAGECEVYMTDLLDYRMSAARECGADWTGVATRDGSDEEIDAVAGPGFDCVFECAGEQMALDQGAELLSPGGELVIVGIPEPDRISFRMDTFRRKEVKVRNVRRQNDCIADAIEMVAAGKVNIDPLVTHHFTLDQTKAAFDMVADYRDGVVKAMIHVTR